MFTDEELDLVEEACDTWCVLVVWRDREVPKPGDILQVDAQGNQVWVPRPATYVNTAGLEQFERASYSWHHEVIGPSPKWLADQQGKYLIKTGPEHHVVRVWPEWKVRGYLALKQKEKNREAASARRGPDLG